MPQLIQEYSKYVTLDNVFFFEVINDLSSLSKGIPDRDGVQIFTILFPPFLLSFSLD